MPPIDRQTALSPAELPSEPLRLQTIQLSDKYTMRRYEDGDISLLNCDTNTVIVIPREGAIRLSGLLRVTDFNKEAGVNPPDLFTAAMEKGLTLSYTNEKALKIVYDGNNGGYYFNREGCEETVELPFPALKALDDCLTRWRYFAVPGKRIEYPTVKLSSDSNTRTTVPAIEPHSRTINKVTYQVEEETSN